MNKVYGLVGQHPQATLLKALHQAAFKAEGIEAEYKLFDIDPNRLEELENFCYETDLNGVAGFSVSDPFMQELMRLMDHYDPLAKTASYLNTVLNEDSLLIGYNTEITGALQALQEKTELTAGKKILVLGARKKGRAISYALKEFGMGVFLWDEKGKLAQDLAEEWELEAVTFSQIKDLNADIIINANDPKEVSEFSKNPLTSDHFKEGLVVMEMGTGESKTPFVEMAEKTKATLIPSDRILLNEAAGQFEIWLEKTAPFGVMEEVLKSYRNKE